MLPVPKLDDQEYDEILDTAINTVVSLFPAWTDFNEHDPGITMLELFATVKESEQYYVDRISRNNRIKYLKLMGIRRRPKRPAKTLIWMKTDQACELMKGHKLDAGGICFETVSGNFLTTYDVHMCMAMRGDELLDQVTTGQMEFGGHVHFYMFGADPQEGDVCYIGFDNQPPFGDPLRIHMRMSRDYPVTRNPLDQSIEFASPVSLRWEYFNGKGWEELELIEDETFGLLFDGFVTFRPENPIDVTTIGEQSGYYIRIRLERGGYEVPPILEGISMNICEAVQTDTLVEYDIFPADEKIYMDTELSILGRSEVYLERDGNWYPAQAYEKGLLETTGKTFFTIEDPKLDQSDRVLVINRDLSSLHRSCLGIGNGFPNQRIDLEDEDVMEEPFAVLIAEYNSEEYRLWERVEDFEASGPGDRHFVIDSEKGVLIFGDSIHGRAPEGEILSAAYVKTRGSGGNIRTGKVDRFVSYEVAPITITNITDGSGGCDEESIEESFLRARQSIRRSECAVTADDYERAVMLTPGLMIESCQVLLADEQYRSEKQVDENTVCIVVQPYGYVPGSPINACYEANIRAWMERFRMVGSPIRFFFPETIEVEVYADLIVKPQYRHEEWVRETVREYFEGFKGQFGKPVLLSRLYGHLDRQEYVMGIRSLSMDARGHGTRRTREGDIILPPHGTVKLTDVKTFLTIG